MPKSYVPFSGEGAEFLSNNVAWAEDYLRTNGIKWHLDPSSLLATIHQRYRQTGHGPVAYEGPLLVTIAQKLQVSVVADETARRAASRQINRAANKGGRSV